MFTLAEAKRRLGITDTTSDVLIQHALDTVLDVAGLYCDRNFRVGQYTEEYLASNSKRIFIKAYPITGVIAVQDAASGVDLPNDGWDVDVEHGFITLVAPYNGFIEIIYDGGIYSAINPEDTPFDLELAFWGIFNNVWASMQPLSGGATSAGGIKKIAIVGVGSVDYDLGSAGATAQATGLIPAEHAAILDLYRRHLT